MLDRLQEIPFKRKKLHSSFIMPFFALSTFVIQCGVILTLMAQGSKINGIASRSIPTLVQMLDGRTISVTPKDAAYREPAVVDRLLRQWLSLSFNWSSTLKDGALDPGVKVKEYAVPETTWEASFVLDESIRTPTLELIGAIKSKLPQGSKVVFQIDKLSLPQPESEIGVWRSKLIATLLVFPSGSKTPTSIDFNKVITLEAAPQPIYPLPDRASDIQQIVYRMRESGVKITAMEDYVAK